MKAMTVRPPYAQLIIYGAPIFLGIANGDGSSRVVLSNKVLLKNIENRTWRLPDAMVGERIAIHAGKTRDPDAMMWLLENRIVAPMVALMLTSNKIETGAILGTVELTGCITESNNPWFTGPFGWTLSNPIPLADPVECLGKQGFWDVDIEAMA